MCAVSTHEELVRSSASIVTGDKGLGTSRLGSPGLAPLMNRFLVVSATKASLEASTDCSRPQNTVFLSFSMFISHPVMVHQMSAPRSGRPSSKSGGGKKGRLPRGRHGDGLVPKGRRDRLVRKSVRAENRSSLVLAILERE